MSAAIPMSTLHVADGIERQQSDGDILIRLRGSDDFVYLTLDQATVIGAAAQTYRELDELRGLRTGNGVEPS